MFCICAGYGVIKLNNSRRRRAKNNQPDAHCFGKSDSGVGLVQSDGASGAKRRRKSLDERRVGAREWCDPGSSRPVTVNLGPGADISLVNRKAEKLRCLSVEEVGTIVVQVTRDAGRTRPMALLKFPRSHDLVLEFESEPTRKRFLTKLESFADELQKSVEINPVYK